MNKLLKLKLKLILFLAITSCSSFHQEISSSLGIFSITGVNPTTGSTTGGTAVTITGTNFDGGTTIEFDGSACSNLAVVSDTQITCDTPAHIAGTVNVTGSSSGSTSTLTNAFIYGTPPAPTLTSVDISTGILTVTKTITLTGTSFITGATIAVGGINCQSSSVVSATSATCNVPIDTDGATVGAKNILFTNPDAQNDSLASAYTYYNAPTFSDLNAGGGVFTVNCNGCHGGAGGLTTSSYASAVARTTPGDPDNSSLYNRLLGSGGALMPQGGPALSASDRQQVYDWILDGAQNN